MTHRCSFLLLFLFISTSTSTSTSTAVDLSTTLNISDLCLYSPNLSSLPSDRLTVLISAYHPSRSALLRRLTLSYSSLPFISSIVILWSNPSSPPPTLPPHPKLHLLPLPSSSLNLRFLPLPSPLLLSRFIAIADDDISPSPHSLSLALSLLSRRPLSLLGFFPRSHALDLHSKSWIYTLHPDRYSIVLTKLMLLRADYLHKYSCWNKLSPARAVVDRHRNCEDILMNFVAAMESGEGPLLVGGRVRDYGDPRNRGKGETEIGRVGLSSRKEHWESRGNCITEFHRLLGVMPLRYSYGKVVGEIGEQGVCRKAGRLVLCDQD
ncbi:hypothetical protein KFK09_006313 [Dendrobium nobile]|uniref:Glycosyl transferase 64 domain-containing protein n=1 Tax=Dendrobium nobile TaxID=94219 RepID=A0A8T3BRS0_DENNO|nr:hypothetical protein KFK09_006313 [Dendrobium nobile]